jgi:uncharacterized protein YjiS (DUF1127 family)
MAKKQEMKSPPPPNTVKELEETLADAQADLEQARTELTQMEDEQLRGLINEEIEAILEEIALLEEALELARGQK